MIKESFQAQVAELQNSLDQQQSEIQKLKERQEEERTEWRTKHDEQIASIENLYERRQKLLEEENARAAAENEELRNEITRLESEMFVFHDRAISALFICI
uniref:Uncharacterized protein n=1 Tax=Ascaris lumbricoides TaxID=6252 RepID=A0A0M3HMA9_ASCLU